MFSFWLRERFRTRYGKAERNPGSGCPGLPRVPAPTTNSAPAVDRIAPPRARRLSQGLSNSLGGLRWPDRGAMSCRTSIAAIAIWAMSAMPAFSGYALDVGATTCTKWVEARRVRGGAADIMHTAWVYGYLSATAGLLVGEASGAVFMGKNELSLIEKADILNPKHIDANGINAWMDKYCQAHPLEKIADAILVLVSALKQKTGYLEEAVCATADLKQEGRASCRNTLEETKRSGVSLLDDLVTGAAKPHRPQPKPAGPARSPQGQPVVGQSQTQAGEPGRVPLRGAGPFLLH